MFSDLWPQGGKGYATLITRGGVLEKMNMYILHIFLYDIRWQMSSNFSGIAIKFKWRSCIVKLSTVPFWDSFLDYRTNSQIYLNAYDSSMHCPNWKYKNAEKCHSVENDVIYVYICQIEYNLTSFHFLRRRRRTKNNPIVVIKSGTVLWYNNRKKQFTYRIRSWNDSKN